jgi:hypothetical protein
VGSKDRTDFKNDFSAIEEQVMHLYESQLRSRELQRGQQIFKQVVCILPLPPPPLKKSDIQARLTVVMKKDSNTKQV